MKIAKLASIALFGFILSFESKAAELPRREIIIKALNASTAAEAIEVYSNLICSKPVAGNNGTIFSLGNSGVTPLSENTLKDGARVLIDLEEINELTDNYSTISDFHADAAAKARAASNSPATTETK